MDGVEKYYEMCGPNLTQLHKQQRNVYSGADALPCLSLSQWLSLIHI